MIGQLVPISSPAVPALVADAPASAPRGPLVRPCRLPWMPGTRPGMTILFPARRR